MQTRWNTVWVVAVLLSLAACNTIGPEYKSAALDGIVPGKPRVSRSHLPPPRSVTIGLISSDATELTLQHLAEIQKSTSKALFGHVRAAADFYDPKNTVTSIAEMLKSRFARVQLIPDMNALASLPKPAVGCVFDLRLTGINDLGGQRATATSDLFFLDDSGAVIFIASGRAYKHMHGGTGVNRSEWMTVQSSVIQQAMEDMRRKLDRKLTASR